MNWPRIRRWLLRRADNYAQNLRLLLIGFGLCFGGILLIAAAELLLAAGLLAEVAALLGLILVAAGCILAALGYLCLSVLRLFRFFNDDRPHD